MVPVTDPVGMYQRPTQRVGPRARGQQTCGGASLDPESSKWAAEILTPLTPTSPPWSLFLRGSCAETILPFHARHGWPDMTVDNVSSEWHK